MIPSARWFPSALPARAAWFQNFATQFSALAASLGFTPADVTSVNNDNAMLQFMNDNEAQISTYSEAVRMFRRIITLGSIGEPTPVFPANPNLANPGNSATGMFERLDILRKQIMLRPNYTDEIGAMLGILTAVNVPPPPSSVKPRIEVTGAQTGYHFSIVVSNREESNSWEAMVLRKNATQWQLAKTAIGKSADVTLAPTTPGDAEQLQVRVQLMKNNEPYGQLSDTVWVTINP